MKTQTIPEGWERDYSHTITTSVSDIELDRIITVVHTIPIKRTKSRAEELIKILINQLGSGGQTKDFAKELKQIIKDKKI